MSLPAPWACRSKLPPLMFRSNGAAWWCGRNGRRGGQIWLERRHRRRGVASF
uniref:Uncharacterized protein n=1 Tax=Arundo donax TaxID=35708 RepID=A0A0A8ZNI8_ARUDO